MNPSFAPKSKAGIRFDLPEPAVAVIYLDNPPLNLISDAMLTELHETVMTIHQDASIRSVIVTGAGSRAFCAGSDLRKLPQEAGEGRRRAYQRHRCYETLETLRQPTIAVLNGPALGGGLELALACDFRLAARGVEVGLTELRFGLFPAGGGTQRLTRLVGEARAKDMIMLGKKVRAEDAADIGLITAAVPELDLWAEALDLARRLAHQPCVALQAAKRAIMTGIRQGFDAGLEAEATLIDAVFLTEDAKEGFDAFRERRAPIFHHR